MEYSIEKSGVDNKENFLEKVLMLFPGIICGLALLWSITFVGVLNMNVWAEDCDRGVTWFTMETGPEARAYVDEVGMIPSGIAEDTSLKEIEASSVQYAAPAEKLEVPDVHSEMKTYMSYKAITCKTSKQWVLQQEAETDELGFRRLDGMYMIALGTYYSKSAGEIFRITLDTGFQFMAITGDVKSDMDTDPLHQHRNGNIVEFIVDTTLMDPIARKTGNISDTAGANFSGKVIAIEHIGSHQF